MGDLELTGLANGPTSLSWDDITAMRGIADVPSLDSAVVGEAVPASVVVDIAQPQEAASYCSVVSSDGEYSASIPIADLVDSGWLAFRLNGETLPVEHGGPLRLTVAEGKTLCWNVKDVGELRFTATKEPDSVPARPEH